MEIIELADFPAAFERAVNDRDLVRFLALHDEEAVLRGRADSGPSAVRAELETLGAAGAVLTNRLRVALRSGDTALIVVDWTLRLGNGAEMSGTATNVLQRRPGRGWRMRIANPEGTR